MVLSPISELVLALFRVAALALVFYFLSCTLYLINRTHRIPSLRAVLQVMRVGLQGAPRIARHRARLAPARIKEVLRHRGRKHIVHPAYPNSGNVSSKIKKKKRK